METSQSISNMNTSTSEKFLSILSWYPYLWTAGVLIYALTKVDALIAVVMFSLVLFIYVGSLTWLALLTFLTVKKKITLTQSLLQVFILATGIFVAYCVMEYDILGSGVKYMD